MTARAPATTVADQRERRGLMVAWTIVLLAAIAHRVVLLVLHRPAFDALVSANHGWYCPQVLPLELLRERFGAAILYLQEAPPVPSLIEGSLAGLLPPSPSPDLNYALILLQSLCSLLTGAVLMRVVSVLYPGRIVLWTAVGLLFLFSTDRVVVEYNALGHLTYEPLTMLLVILTVDVLVGLRRTGRPWYAGAAGVTTALLALTRATWSFFALPCLVLVLALAPARRLRAALVCCLPMLLLQGGWSVKNWAIYGVLSPATATWGGFHAVIGIQNAGFKEQLDDFVRQQATPANGYADWELCYARRTPPYPDCVPEAIHRRDREIQQILGSLNPFSNTLECRTMAAFLQHAAFDFTLAHPGLMATKWWRAYRIFWQPIANQGRQFVGLFAVGNQITDGFDFPGILRAFREGALPDTQWIMSGTHPYVPGGTVPIRLEPTRLYTLRWLDPFVLMLNVLAVNVLLPLVAVCWLVERARRQRAASSFDPLRMSALLVSATLYAYLAGLVNLVETLENMRYRSEVEPVIWLITLICMTELAAFVRGRRPAAAVTVPAR